MIRLEPLKPIDALAALLERGKRLDPSFDWQDLFEGEHAKAFTVAKSAGFDVLDDIYEATRRALDEGETLEDFSRKLRPTLVEKGWWGRADVLDPVTGEPRPVQLGSERRLKTIFETNMRVSYASGHWAAFQRNKEFRPYLRYVAIDDDRTRPWHRRLHNLVLPVDHPFWDRFAPPNGWGCRCTLQSLSQRDIDRLQAQGEELYFEPPEISERPWTNRRTGEVLMVPDGIDPGWDYNPGRAGYRAVLEESLEEKERRPNGWLGLEPSGLQWPPPARRTIEAEQLAARLNAGQAEWEASLSIAEREAIESYKAEGHALINGYLRGNLDADAEPAEIEWAMEEARAIATALASARLPEPITVFRGLPPHLVDRLGRIEPGEDLADPGYLSTSLLERVAESFNGAMIAEIRIPKDARAIALIHSIPDVNHVEYEVLLDQGYRLRYLRRTENRILLEAIPND